MRSFYNAVLLQGIYEPQARWALISSCLDKQLGRVTQLIALFLLSSCCLRRLQEQSRFPRKEQECQHPLIPKTQLDGISHKARWLPGSDQHSGLSCLLFCCRQTQVQQEDHRQQVGPMSNSKKPAKRSSIVSVKYCEIRFLDQARDSNRVIWGEGGMSPAGLCSARVGNPNIIATIRQNEA